ncbi:NUDIX domain-containing protein [Halobaculum gomorrense]|uniref:ADP-ribose pyrophosphatase YjhB, NUDIX family n=1 Tax=Halobaculum gomorrense TaxID=43928 RepID=A0A1M5JFE9_9EURY|nr:NUDIX domain-containing protein [Halobaculum gomorrense]SHG39316.1 ADP-ribose pyrophosphatase YjhB, NUDIX family [Halobaculum gomorrense]
MTDIRGAVLGAIRHPDTGEYLVQRLSGTDETHFHRFVGGGIEPGEPSDEALEREFAEELDVTVDAGSPVCTVENLFEFGGESHHEFAVVRAATFADRSLYDRETFSGVDNVDGDGERVEYEAYWRTLADLRDDDAPFFPAGVAEAVERDGHAHVVSTPDADRDAVDADGNDG